MPFGAELVRGGNMPEKFNELLLKQDIIELYKAGITPDYGYLMNGRFEKNMIKTLYPLKTLSGNPISWEASDTEYLFPVVSLEPKQAGSGDPSPENVRPISGYDSVEVNVRGKNLLSDENFQSSEKNGITFTKLGNGVVHIEGTATANVDSNIVQDVPQLPPGTYYGISQYLTVVVKKASTGSNVWYDVLNGVTIEIGDVVQYYYFAVSASITVNETLYIFLAPGESAFSASDFELYQPGTTATLALPKTIYGGTVDAVTGVGSEEWSPVLVLDSASFLGYLDANSNETTCLFYMSNVVNQTSKTDICCSHLPVVDSIAGATSTDIGISGNIQGSTLYFRLPRTTASNLSEFEGWLDEQKTASTPVQVTYKLANPTPFQATGNQALTSLLGYNTIYTNGDSITLNRKARRLEV